MAYQYGYQGGYADTAVVIEPAPVGGPVWSPTRPARPSHREGRSTLRLKVTVLTWGTEGAHRSQHIMATALLASGQGETRTSTTFSSDPLVRHGHAKTASRTDIRTHVGEPREDDHIVLLAAAFLLSEHPGSTP